MLTEHRPILGDDIALLAGYFKQVGIIAIVEVLALFLIHLVKALSHVNGTHLSFRHAPQRKECSAQLLLAEAIEEVGLVFLQVNSLGKIVAAVLFGYACIVTGSELVKDQSTLHCIFDHGTELDLGIAPDAGIWCAAIHVFVLEVGKHDLFEKITQLEHLVLDADLPADALDRLDIFTFVRGETAGGAQRSFEVGAFIPDGHCNAHNLMPLLLEQVCRNRGIDTSAHTNQYLHDASNT
ncbi:hypothetical protein SDC9_149485 [bioreactor metagenome]|uniref:Uncharacterized protein n=1 Tax=bioreactor metagenome TaxID=1076179 RepID=A0A645EJW5_9ZZZZ